MIRGAIAISIPWSSGGNIWSPSPSDGANPMSLSTWGAIPSYSAAHIPAEQILCFERAELFEYRRPSLPYVLCTWGASAVRDTWGLPARRGRAHTAVRREMRNNLPNTTQKEPVGHPLRGPSRARSRERPGRPGPPPPSRSTPSDPRIGEGCLPDRGASLFATPKLSRHA